VAELERVVPELLPELRSGDLVLTLGAGSVSRLGPQLLQALAETRQ
jgi:UDP-N-acetylmuramate-alanine ligase